MSSDSRSRHPSVDAVAAFVESARAHPDAQVYAAIDPGVTGAIALVCGRLYAVFDIPVYTTTVAKRRALSEKEREATGRKTHSYRGGRTEFDHEAICDIFYELRPLRERIRLALEQVPPSLGPGRRQAEILLNRAYAMWPLFLHAKGYSVEKVAPGDWKLVMGLRGKDKEASRHKALALFPKAPLGRKKDHDRAEALLLAEFLRRAYEGAKRR